MHVFAPEKGKPLPPFDLRMSVALSKCSENSAAAPLVLLYYALLRCSGRQGPPSRNQEPHKLLCDSQNASHNHLTCGIKVSHPMRCSLEALLCFFWMELVLFCPSSLPRLYLDDQYYLKELLF